jgi:hypothetical protein
MNDSFRGQRGVEHARPALKLRMLTGCAVAPSGNVQRIATKEHADGAQSKATHKYLIISLEIHQTAACCAWPRACTASGSAGKPMLVATPDSAVDKTANSGSSVY